MSLAPRRHGRKWRAVGAVPRLCAPQRRETRPPLAALASLLSRAASPNKRNYQNKLLVTRGHFCRGSLSGILGAIVRRSGFVHHEIYKPTPLITVPRQPRLPLLPPFTQPPLTAAAARARLLWSRRRCSGLSCVGARGHAALGEAMLNYRSS